MNINPDHQFGINHPDYHLNHAIIDQCNSDFTNHQLVPYADQYDSIVGNQSNRVGGRSKSFNQNDLNLNQFNNHRNTQVNQLTQSFNQSFDKNIDNLTSQSHNNHLIDTGCFDSKIEQNFSQLGNQNNCVIGKPKPFNQSKLSLNHSNNGRNTQVNELVQPCNHSHDESMHNLTIQSHNNHLKDTGCFDSEIERNDYLCDGEKPRFCSEVIVKYIPKPKNKDCKMKGETGDGNVNKNITYIKDDFESPEEVITNLEAIGNENVDKIDINNVAEAQKSSVIVKSSRAVVQPRLLQAAQPLKLQAEDIKFIKEDEGKGKSKM